MEPSNTMTTAQNKPIEFHFKVDFPRGHLKSIKRVPASALALIQRYDPSFPKCLVPMGDGTFANSTVLTWGAIEALKSNFQESGFEFINVLDLYDEIAYDRIDQCEHTLSESNPSH